MLIVSHAWSNLMYCMNVLTPGWNLPHRRLRRTVRTTDNAHCVNYLYASPEFQTAIKTEVDCWSRLKNFREMYCSYPFKELTLPNILIHLRCVWADWVYVNRVTSLKTNNTFFHYGIPSRIQAGLWRTLSWTDKTV